MTSVKMIFCMHSLFTLSLSAIINPCRVFFWEGESWQAGGGSGPLKAGAE